jgi:hypothetical protein
MRALGAHSIDPSPSLPSHHNTHTTTTKLRKPFHLYRERRGRFGVPTHRRGERSIAREAHPNPLPRLLSSFYSVLFFIIFRRESLREPTPVGAPEGASLGNPAPLPSAPFRQGMRERGGGLDEKKTRGDPFFLPLPSYMQIGIREGRRRRGSRPCSI